MNRGWTHGAGIGLAVALTGCAALPGGAGPTRAPDPRAPAQWQAPLPSVATMVAKTAATATATAAATAPLRVGVDFWSHLDDPLLSALIVDARAVSPGVAAALTRIEQARAARAAASGAPTLDAAAAAARARLEPGAPTESTASTVSLGLQASWELDLFGAVRAGSRGAQARVDAAQAAAQATQVSLAAEVASTYTTLRACEAQVAQAQADADSRNQTARVTDLAAKAGLQAPATAALARASAAQARSQLTAQQAQCAVLVKALVALTAREEPALRGALAPGRARLPQPVALAPDLLPARLVAQRPDLAEAGYNVAAAAADQQGAEARLWPRVSVAGSIGALRVSTSAGSSDGTTWSLGPVQVSFPVFDGGVRSANRLAARAAYDEAVVRYQAQLRTAVREVEESLVALQSTEGRGQDAAVAAEGFEASFRAAEARFKGGLASVFELEDARRTAVAARSALVELQRERVLAWISLYRALGGGWTSADPAVASTTPR